MVGSTRSTTALAALATGCILSASESRAAVINSVSVFATAPAGATLPDSVSVGGGSVFVAYAGGTDSQAGTGQTTIQQYGMDGTVQQTYRVSGSADGLKYNPATGQVYVL